MAGQWHSQPTLTSFGQGFVGTCNWSGNAWPQSSQLTEPLLADPGLKSGIHMHELIFTEKKGKR